jgi:hypothetical protein
MISHDRSSSSKTTFLKFGRSVKPVARLAQWRSQCPARTPLVRDIFPRSSATTGQAGAGVGGALEFGERGGRNHRRWERLVLIEVAGRAALEATTRNGSIGTKAKEACADCGKRHCELFEVGMGAYEKWGCEVVQRWGRFAGILN